MHKMPTAQPVRKVQQPSRPPAADAIVRAVCARQDDARAANRYQIIGKLFSVETDRGRIQFEAYKGPGIAQTFNDQGAPDGLVFVSEWKTLPLTHSYTEEFCPKCLGTCDVCQGSGKIACIFVGCGGRGQVQQGESECPACVKVAGKFNPACETCGGRGAVAKLVTCPACSGTSQATCATCRGAGQRPTGRNHANTGMCETCRGTQRNSDWTKQDLEKLIIGGLAGYVVLGPVLRLVLTPITGASQPGAEGPSAMRGGNAFLRIVPKPDSTGQAMLILFPKPAAGAPLIPFFFGGTID